jgi:4-amino-4-deoxy-L-arabinose transferase-like glycosyltransferase
MNNIKKQISQIFSDERNILISLMLFGLISKLFNLTSPLLDYHSWRQTDTAGIARNFYNNGFNIIYPQIDWGGAGPGYVESEFQLVPFIISLFYKIFGVHEYIARLVVIAFSVGSIYLLYRMIRMHYSQRVAAFSIIFFIISPLELYLGRAVMPESAMIFFSIGSLYFFDKWTKVENINTFILALICTSLAFLVKISTLYLGLPLLWLAYNRYGRRLLFEPKLYVFAIITLIPPTMWYYFAHSVLAQYNTLDFWNLGSGSKFANLEMFLDPEMYKLLFTTMTLYVLTPIGLLLFIYGLSLKTKLVDYVFHFWVLAVIIFFLILAAGVIGNDYYQIALAPAAAVFVGRALSGIYEKKKMASYILVAFILMPAVYYTAPMYIQNSVIFDAAATLDKVSSPDALIITTNSLFGSSPNLLYYSNRKGWVVPEEGWSSKTIESMKGQGARYLVIAPQILFFSNPQFGSYLFETYRSLIGSNFVIFDLSQASDIHLLPNQTDLSFTGDGPLMGGNFKEAASGLLNIACYFSLENIYNNTNKTNGEYYLLRVDFLDKDGRIINGRQFLTSELPPNGTIRNDYVVLLSEDEKAEIYDSIMELSSIESVRNLSAPQV